MKCFPSVVAVVALLLAASVCRAALVIAIRYLQAEGVSHSHLYLYREDGKLLRQLTNGAVGQDQDPIFSPKGETIVFAKEMPAGIETWSIEPRGGGLQRLTVIPQWYLDAKTSPYFTNADTAGDLQIKTPDGREEELLLQKLENDKDDQVDGLGHGKHYLLRDLRSGKQVEMGKLPGFEGLFSLLHRNDAPEDQFLIEPLSPAGTSEKAIRLAFFDLHLDSTDGDACYALDLIGKRIVRLSPNWATPVPLRGDAAFLTLTSNRYVPIPKSEKTANCSYIERWDSALQHVRYAEPGSAAICYGMSMFRQGKTPEVVVIRKDVE